MQTEIHNFIKEKEMFYGQRGNSNKFCLYVFSVSSDIKQVSLIEELRNQQQNFANQIQDEVVRDIFKILKD
jgi:hypothetical protein